MIIRRMRNFSEAEREYSLTELVEIAYSEGYKAAQREYSKNDKDDYTLDEKLSIGLAKLNPKGYNRAVTEAYGDKKDFRKLAKWSAGMHGVGLGATGAGLGAVMAGGKGAAVGGLIGATTGAGGGYAGTRLGGALHNKVRKINRDEDEKSYRVADMAAVASGDMTKEEYLKRHGKRNK